MGGAFTAGAGVGQGVEKMGALAICAASLPHPATNHFKSSAGTKLPETSPA
jgi:hypothetical protein